MTDQPTIVVDDVLAHYVSRLTWQAVAEYPAEVVSVMAERRHADYASGPIKCSGFILARGKRISDVGATGGTDQVMFGDSAPTGIATWFGSAESVMAMYPHAERGVARVERVDDRPRVYVRTPTGEYEASVLLPGNIILGDSVGRAVLELERLTQELAFLRHRDVVARRNAIHVPAQASALQRATMAGRTVEVRQRELLAAVDARVVRLTRTVEVEGKKRRAERVTVELVQPKGTAAMRLKLKTEHPVFPELAAAPRDQLPVLVSEALARRLQPRAYQAVMATIGHVYQAKGVELDDAGEMPKAFRLGVMRTMGMDPVKASAAQGRTVADAIAFARYVEMHVKPLKGSRSAYVPLMLVSDFQDSDEVTTRRAGSLVVNPKLADAMDEGRGCWRIPEALFQVTDGADPTGVIRLLGFQLAHRIGMGTKGTERLELLLRKASCWELMEREAAERGQRSVLDGMARVMDDLRALPWLGHSPADVIGGTFIRGDSLSDAVVTYADPPGWTRSSA